MILLDSYPLFDNAIREDTYGWLPISHKTGKATLYIWLYTKFQPLKHLLEQVITESLQNKK